MKLYPQQEELLVKVWNELNTSRRVCMQLPTGGGKTVIAAVLAQTLNGYEGRVLFLVHRVELLEQAENTLRNAGLEFGTIAAGRPMDLRQDHQVASVQTLVRRLDALPGYDGPTLIVIDEAHHAAATTWEKVIGHWPNARLLGLTATPERLDGKGLNKWFDVLVCGPTVKELVGDGLLAPSKVIAPDIADWAAGIKTRAGEYAKDELAQRALEGTNLADVTEAYKDNLIGKRVVIFACSVEHSQNIVHRLMYLGVNAAHIDANTDKTERKQILQQFSQGRIDAICNVGLIDEGFDCVGCDAVLDAHPTKSLTKWLQRCGRALRPQEGKQAVIVDCGGNVWRHGLPTQDRIWSLEGVPNGRRVTNANVGLRNCARCFSVYETTKKECPHCGSEAAPGDASKIKELPVSMKVVTEEEVANKKLQHKALMRQVYSSKGSTAILEELKEKFDFADGWVYHMQNLINRQGR